MLIHGDQLVRLFPCCIPDLPDQASNNLAGELNCIYYNRTIRPNPHPRWNRLSQTFPDADALLAQF